MGINGKRQEIRGSSRSTRSRIMKKIMRVGNIIARIHKKIAASSAHFRQVILFKRCSSQSPAIGCDDHGQVLHARKSRFVNIGVSSSPLPDAPGCFQRRKWIPDPPKPFALPRSPSQLRCRWPIICSNCRICWLRISNANGRINPDALGGGCRVIIVNQTAFGGFDMIRGQTVGN